MGRPARSNSYHFSLGPVQTIGMDKFLPLRLYSSSGSGQTLLVWYISYHHFFVLHQVLCKSIMGSDNAWVRILFKLMPTVTTAWRRGVHFRFLYDNNEISFSDWIVKCLVRLLHQSMISDSIPKLKRKADGNCSVG